MINAIATDTPVDFFTAVFPGFYVFTRTTLLGAFLVNGNSAGHVGGVGGPAVNQRGQTVVWLNSGDVVSYVSPIDIEIRGGRFAQDELA